MRLPVNPTRMELLKLRKRLVVARRGHKLLKDKLDGLTKEFMRVSQEYKNLRIALDEELPRVLKLFVLAEISSSRLIVENALDSTRQDLEIVKHEKRLMGVMIPRLEAVFGDVTGHYSLVHTPPELDQAIASLKDFLPKLLHMAEIEETVRRMSMELEKTRRRVNALEHSFIPRIVETVKYITSKLDEMERSTTARLMKIKARRSAEETTR